MAIPVQQFIDKLTAGHRVVLLGGVAIIAHGRERHTYDADIWLDPMDSADEWARVVLAVCNEVPGTTIHRLPGWVEVSGGDVARAVEEIGMIRVLGLGEPLDIFRRPNEFDESAFGEVAGRAHQNKDGTLLPDPLDLLQSKLETNRDKDRDDILHLENLTRASYCKRLPAATPAEASAMLARYSEWQVLQAALENPSPEVRELAMSHLREFAAAGDPFSLAILEGREIP
jgi:hypothetical protein